MAYGLSWPTLGTGIILSVQPERMEAQQVGWLAGLQRLLCCAAAAPPRSMRAASCTQHSPWQLLPQAMMDSGVLPQQEVQQRHQANSAAMEMIRKAAGQQR